jgi:sugar phosphate isomerase/epimerase
MLRAYAEYLPGLARSRVGVEIQDLIHPGPSTPALPDPLAELADFWGKALEPHPLPVSFHGPSITRRFGSGDLREEPPSALGRAMDLASGLGARHFIVHPELGRAAARSSSPAGSLPFWRRVLEEARARNLVLVLENTGEDDPHLLRRLTASIESPFIGLCLDLGHAFQSSSLPVERWLEAFGNDLLYVHLYNQRRDETLHRALGEGEIDILRFLDRLASSRPGLPVCLEMELPEIEESVAWLEARGFACEGLTRPP